MGGRSFKGLKAGLKAQLGLETEGIPSAITAQAIEEPAKNNEITVLNETALAWANKRKEA